jgi:nucleoside-diphosphate-sugar epimerase
MAVLISGGYGLLGSWLTYEFTTHGQEVIVLDVVRKNLDYLEELDERITYVEANVLDFPRLVEIFTKYRDKISGIIHTIAVMATPSFWRDPHRSLNLNIMGTVNTLEIARLFHIDKYLYVSSGAVYGELEENAHEEKHSPHPSDLYGASKASAEFIGQQYANHYNIDYRCVRPYFFFGPGKVPSEQPFLFKNLLGPLEGLEGLHLEKGADQKLGFTYVKDVAHGTYLLYNAKDPRHHTMNIASEEAVSFLEIVRLARIYSDTPTDVQIGPGKLFPRGETLDISIAKEEFDFSPSYGIEDAMKEYAEWIRKNKKEKR